MKRGQLTLFVIISIIIVLLLFVFFSLRDEEVTSYPSSVQVIYGNLESCMTINFIGSLDYVGLYGINANYDFSYYYIEGENTLPPLSEFEHFLSSLSTESIRNCILFQEDVSDAYSFSFYDLNGSVTFDSENAYLRPQGMVSINFTNVSYLVDLSEITIAHPSDFPAMHDAASFFVSSLVTHSEQVPVSEMEVLTQSNHLDFYYEENFTTGDMTVLLISKREFHPQQFWFLNDMLYDFPSEVGFLYEL